MTIAADLEENAHTIRVFLASYEKTKSVEPIDILALSMVADDLERISKETKDEPR